MQALSKTANAFHYIDGFAGPGSYAQTSDGSPLLALSLLAKQPLPSAMSLVERDPENFHQLEAALTNRPELSKLWQFPVLRQGLFEDFAEEILAHPIYTQFAHTATFAFIDPCAVRGVRMQDLRSIIGRRFGEFLLFWNYDGLNRWLGLINKEGGTASELADFFGDTGAARRALECFRSASATEAKEQGLRELFAESIRSRSGARFVLPFRFESDDAERTSHYLIHCSSNTLAFRLMKDIMHDSASGMSDSGTFQHLGEKEHGATIDLFRPRLDQARAEILQRLSLGPAAVSSFTIEWANRPDDYVAPKGYRQLLLDLEREGKLEVLKKSARDRKPVSARIKAGKPTLGDTLVVRRVPPP
jgi:three-Cys-motif partner protein